MAIFNTEYDSGLLGLSQKAATQAGKYKSAMADNFTKISEDYLAREAQAKKDARTAVLDQRAKEQYERQKVLNERVDSEYLKKKEEETAAAQAINDLLAGGSSSKTVSVPGSPGNAGKVAAIKNTNAKVAEGNKSILGDQEAFGQSYLDAYDKFINEKHVSGGLEKPSNPKAEGFVRDSVPGTSYENYTTASGEKKFLDPSSFLGKLVYGGPGKTLSEVARKGPTAKYTEEEAGQKALEYAKSQANIAPTTDLLKVPKVQAPSKGGTKTVTKNMSKKDWTKNAFNVIASNPNLSANTKTSLLGNIGKYADSLYGKDKTEMTFGNKIALQRLNLDILKTTMDNKVKAQEKEQELLAKDEKKLKDTDKALASALSKVSASNFVYGDRSNANAAVEEAKKKGKSTSVITNGIIAATDEEGDFRPSLFEDYINNK